jgi:DNA sulfur modification protein DndC
LCGDDRLLYETTRNLLDIERQYRLKGARHGLFDKIQKVIRSGFFADEADALEWRKKMKQIEEEPKWPIESPSGQLDFAELENKEVRT